MRATTLLRKLLALKQTRVTGFEFTDFGIEVDVAPTTRVPYCSGARDARGACMTTGTGLGGTSTVLGWR